MSSNDSHALLKIYIDVRNKRLLFYQDDQLVRRYPIVNLSDGLPMGKSSIAEKVFNPEPCLGTRWLGFDKYPYGIYGVSLTKDTENDLGVIINNEHLEDLYALVPVDTFVEVTKVPLNLETPSLPNQFGRFPATPLAFPVVPGPHAYIVRKGDTIWKLSKRFDISMESILACNLLIDPNRLDPGQIIHLPVIWPK